MEVLRSIQLLCSYMVVMCTSVALYLVQGENIACPGRGIVLTNISNWIPTKISRAQRVLRAQTETEAIERALDLVIAEHKSNRLGVEANDRFVKSGIEIKDVYGKLEP